MSDTAKTKADMIGDAADAKAAARDARMRDLVDKWMAQIREICEERPSPRATQF
jgi:hypothetical protein